MAVRQCLQIRERDEEEELPGFKLLTPKPKKQHQIADAPAATLQVALPADDRTSTPPAAMTHAVVPSPAAKTAMEAAQDLDGAMPPLSPQEQAESMLRAWGILSEGMENDVADVQGGGKTRGCQSKPILKKPSSCLKKPAAAKAKVIKKPAANFSAEVAASRAKIRAMSRSKRLSVSPRGCGKCRWTPGCTPSCFDS